MTCFVFCVCNTNSKQFYRSLGAMLINILQGPITLLSHPVSWSRDIAMRVGVLGRPHQGECLPGFTRPNVASPCGESNVLSQH